MGVSYNSNIGMGLSGPAELLTALTASGNSSFICCFRDYAVPTASPLYHSLYLSFMVPSMRSSCLNYAGSHLYSYLGNCGILLYIGRSYVYILYHILLAGVDG